jgi:hypothetical protein
MKWIGREAVVAYVGFEVLTGVTTKSSIFRDITSCSPVKVNRRFCEHISSIFNVEYE